MQARTLSVLAVLAVTAVAAAQSTAFTYQGRLRNGAALATGLHDFRFTLFNVVSGGVQLATPQCVDNILVTEGLFTATLDFGQQYVTTESRFLQIEVRADTGLSCANPAGLILLGPRQPLTAAPIATHAKTAFSLAAADGSPASAVSVDNAGNVGVGTTSPQANLHITGNGQLVRLQGQSAGVDNSCYLAFANGSGTDLGYIGDGSSGDNNMYLTSYTGDIYLYTAVGATVSAKANGNVGIGTTSPLAKLDVRGNIRLGNSGEYFAPSGQENLRIVRGIIAEDGTQSAGSGFACSRIAEGRYSVTFTTPFSGIPVVTATADRSPTGTEAAHAVMTDLVTASTLEFLVRNTSGNVWQDRTFQFIAIGPR